MTLLRGGAGGRHPGRWLRRRHARTAVTGADRLEGGFGGDVFIVDDAGDVVVELAGQGNDRVSTALTAALPANVEALTLSGSGQRGRHRQRTGQPAAGQSRPQPPHRPGRQRHAHRRRRQRHAGRRHRRRLHGGPGG
ncbi:MAG: hypothetical protein MZW92_55215 [Comamonadaceae bacterium]|nr:hypothetical protein [Comamonadaceae bacterium]